MGRPTGFLEHPRRPTPTLEPRVRLRTFAEVGLEASPEHLRHQASRCMDCGVPFCQSGSGCPLHNLIPDWNDLVHRDRAREALERLHATNNFPEITGRVCPAPCEGACVLGLEDAPVTIRNIEQAIADRGFDEGWIAPEPATARTGRRVAVVGSGPAGLAAAQQLARRGHDVTVYERADRVGGLLVYGIPNMKLDKSVVARRVEQLAAEGVRFVTNADVGVNVDAGELRSTNDAVLLACGATLPRDLDIEGRSLAGVHFAMDLLEPTTKRLLDAGQGTQLSDGGNIEVAGKRVVVIGGGDTGTDCIATVLRLGCASVTALEILDAPPDERAESNPWPEPPRVFHVDYGHAEARALFGDDPRRFHVMTQRFVADDRGAVAGVETIEVERTTTAAGVTSMHPAAGTERVIPADLVLLALGFTGPEPALARAFGIARDERTRFTADAERFETSVTGVYAAGDCRRGQSLVVWAIAEGRAAARAIDRSLSCT